MCSNACQLYFSNAVGKNSGARKTGYPCGEKTGYFNSHNTINKPAQGGFGIAKTKKIENF